MDRKIVHGYRSSHGVMNAVLAVATHNSGCVRQSNWVNSVSINYF